MPKIAIVAALNREVKPLVSDAGWQRSKVVRAVYGCYERECAIVACGGIGAEPARRTAEEVVRNLKPAVLVSAGVAGALVPEWKVAQVMIPETIIHSINGGTQTAMVTGVAGICRGGILVSASGIPGTEGKRLLAGQYHAQAVDMEAAAVAEIARVHGIPFVAVKAISDEYDFPMPDLESFVDEHGRFKTGSFVFHAMTRPALWPVMRKLASNSARASQELCSVLRILLTSDCLSDIARSSEQASSTTRLEQTSQ